MKRTLRLLFALTGVYILSACELRLDSKMLASVLESAAAETADDYNGNKADEQCVPTDSMPTVDSLMYPAPLTGTPEQILKRTAYIVSYNKDTRLPNWVAWHLTASHTEGTHKRPRKAFREDEEVPEPRATDWDYYNSGYDRGHICPAGDNKWSEQAMLESFLFTNICPQNHSLNAGDWSEMENQCRRWAKEYGDIYIVSGPILYKGRHKTIGKNKVVVPEAFFKVVLCMNPKPKAIGFIYKNTAGNRHKGDYVNTVDDVERITGFDFFPALPDEIENSVEATCDWYE